MNFLEKLGQNVQHLPNKIAMKVNLQSKGISYGELDILSGRVLSYLNKKQIGKEDFVAIYLPRGVEPLICVIGVLKAGAAFVIIEENYALERTEFIKKDCGSKLVIDYAVWQEIQHEQPTAVTALWDDHAAALVYTSGSTGVPKGVVHEYGNIEKIILSLQVESLKPSSDDRLSLIIPLTFVVSLMAFFITLFAAATFYVVPYTVIKNPKAFYVYLLENCITVTFLPPSVFRAFPNFGPHMRMVILGGEIAVQTYNEGVIAVNIYSMSEVGAAITYFTIDKLYNITPIGTPPIDLGIRLLDEEGNMVPDGEIGELCVYTPFVRGYLNRPVENELAFREGHIYHTGDLACKLPDGNYVVHGRKDDMIKINGNRIEPGEIEEVVRRVLGLDWVSAKGFTEGDSGFICVYYTQDIEIDEEKTRQELLQHLPYYMLPSHFIKLDSVPLNSNGKLDRKALLPPVKEKCQEEYTAPTNELESQLCNAFAKALHLDRIGIHDDFYQLGGDSLGAITALSFCDIEGLTASEIFRGRTPEKIAKLCMELLVPTLEEDENAALTRSFLLTPEQLYMVDYQLYVPKSTMYNLSFFARLHHRVDVERFTCAVNQTILRHPALLTVFDFNEDGEMIQHYNAAFAKPIAAEPISERDLSALKDTLICPYTIIGAPLYRCRLFKTEESLYFFFDVHHTVFDGTSFHVLLHDINALYSGETALSKDFYYDILAQNTKTASSPAYKEGLDYFASRYDKEDFEMLETYASKTSENRIDCIKLLLPKIQDLRFTVAPMHQPLSNNILFLAVTALTIAQYSKKPYATFSWIYNGRSSAKHMSTVGLLLNMLPLSVKLPGNRTFTDILEDIGEQVSLGIQHGCVHYLAKKKQSRIDYNISMLYQDTMYNFGMICGEKVEILPLKRPYAASQGALDIEICQDEQGTLVMFGFNAGQFDSSFIESLSNTYGKIAIKLLAGTTLKELTVNDLLG